MACLGLGEAMTKRDAVMFFITPPESLRNATREQIEYVIRQPANLEGLIQEIVHTIYKHFNSEPADPAVLDSVIDNLKNIRESGG